MQVIGVTGGSGTGKSTLLDICAKQGAKVIDCDKLYHKLLVENKALLDEIRSHFPSAFDDGGLNRKDLGKLVFADKTALADLNQITHKYVCKAVDELLESYRNAGEALVVIEAIALVESGLNKRTDTVIAVLAAKEMRTQRIVKREDISLAYATRRIDGQQEDTFFRKHADFIIENNGTQAEFRQRARTCIKEILSNGLTI